MEEKPTNSSLIVEDRSFPKKTPTPRELTWHYRKIYRVKKKGVLVERIVRHLSYCRRVN